ncbi:hypothetical protein ANCDUO_07357 [Ancylostoma duodenale]|uniref:Uncharacterized protein n=1 Tax=Ancylostoma duodenale TaxID=51022 RepID=A0A0C2GZ38_9BILA|nr:hypothetical protein ANCDUO_07357 [Ancylostoma duodenale]
MDWPACSPDCNSVENMCGIVRNDKQYNAVESFKTAILVKRDQNDDAAVLKLVRSMPHRIFEIIRNNGGPIDY